MRKRLYDLRFEISNLNYPGNVHIASNGLLFREPGSHFPGTSKIISWDVVFREIVFREVVSQ